MTTGPRKPSIRSIPLPTTGAGPARAGYGLQDHVAAGYCIEMVSDARMKEVWSEAHDDVVLIWESSESDEIEFVQVKGAELDQLWSVAQVCSRKASGTVRGGTSIVERSLSQHACSEPCRFRIVTSTKINSDLDVLTHALDSNERKDASAALAELSSQIREKLKDARSPNGQGTDFWVSRTTWQVVHGLDAIRLKNLDELERQLESLGYLLVSNQKREVYDKLVQKVWDAALAKKLPLKIISRAELRAWLAKTASQVSQPAPVGGQKMTEKLRAAGLPEDAIAAATDARMRYRHTALISQYSEPSKVKAIESEVSARLSVLRARLDAGEYANDGLSFYSRCLNDLETFLLSNSDAGALGLAFLQGCMYSMTDRCAHRFTKVAQ